jgi:hypothetical protein
MQSELPDTAEAMENGETAHQVPIGWVALAAGLILWGVWYLWTYSPWSTGWTQAAQLEGAQAAGADAGTNIFMTILFTALPTAAAIGLWLMQRRAKS